MQSSEIAELLKARGQEQQELFRLAREARKREFGDQVDIRAIIEPSNYCRNACLYCAMRNGSNLISRYRMSVGEIVQIAEQMMVQGVNIFSLETGEDPEAIDAVAKSAATITSKRGKIVGICGILEKEGYQKLKDAGIDYYLLKFETSDAELFHRLRPGTTLQHRLENLEYLQKLEFAITTGNIVGLPGQSLSSLVDDIMLIQSLEPYGATVSPFIPSPGTPVEKEKYGDVNLALNTLAIYRIILPKSHIPALCALNFFPGIGQLGALNSGANDMLINTAHTESLACQFAIYSKDKKLVTLEEGLEVIHKAGLKQKVI